MAENELTIVLRLDDKASKEVSDALKKISGETDKSGQKGKEAADKQNASWLRLTITIASAIKAYRMVSNTLTDVIKVGRTMDSSFNQSFNNFELSVLRVKQVLAEQLIPVLKTSLDFWSNFLNNTFESSDIESYNKQLEAAKRNMDVMASTRERLQKSVSSKEDGALSFMFSRQAIESDKERIKLLDAQIGLEKTRIATIENLLGKQRQDKNNEFEKNLELEKGRQILEEHKRQISELNVLFQSGQIASQQYYQGILAGAQSVVAVNQVAAQQLGEMARLTAEIQNNQLLNAERQTQEQIDLLNFYKENYMTAHRGMAAFTVTVAKSIQTNLSSALTNIVTGVESAKEAFQAFGRAMIQAIVEFIAQKIVASVIEKTILAGTVIASSAAGAAIAAAWLPAATFVSLATLGANAIPAAAGMASVSALATGIALAGQAASKTAGGRAGFAQGTDSVPAMLSPGEMVIPNTFAEAIRANRLSLGGPGGGGGDVYITMSGVSINSKEDVRSLAEELGFEITRKLRNARSNV